MVSPQCVTNREFTETLGRVLRRPTWIPMPAMVAGGRWETWPTNCCWEATVSFPADWRRRDIRFVSRNWNRRCGTCWESEPSSMSHNYDALLFVSFGGPEGPDEVLPYLENVLRGRNVPRQRMLEVCAHYQQFAGSVRSTPRPGR